MHTRLAALVAAALLPAAAAAAQDTPQPAADNWSFSAGVATDGRSKGTSKTMGDPYAYVAGEWTDDSGVFYAGADLERVRHGTGADAEAKLSAGYRPEVWGYEFDFNAAHKWYLAAADGSDADSWEFTADVARSIGPASGRLRFQYSPDSAGATRSWTWVEARAGWRFSPKLGASAAVGRREQSGGVDYTAWNVGGTYDLTENLELDLRWYDTSERELGETYDSALVAAVNVYF